VTTPRGHRSASTAGSVHPPGVRARSPGAGTLGPRRSPGSRPPTRSSPRRSGSAQPVTNRDA